MVFSDCPPAVLPFSFNRPVSFACCMNGCVLQALASLISFWRLFTHLPILNPKIPVLPLITLLMPYLPTNQILNIYYIFALTFHYLNLISGSHFQPELLQGTWKFLSWLTKLKIISFAPVRQNHPLVLPTLVPLITSDATEFSYL